MTWLLLSLWFDTKNTDKHTEPIYLLTHKYILAPPVMCAQKLPVLQWMNKILTRRLMLQRFTTSLLFKSYSLLEVIQLVIGFNKTKSLLWNNQKHWWKWYKWAKHTQTHTDTHTHITHRKKDEGLVSVSDPLPFVGKFWSFHSPPTCLGKFWKLKAFLFLKDGF